MCRSTEPAQGLSQAQGPRRVLWYTAKPTKVYLAVANVAQGGNGAHSHHLPALIHTCAVQAIGGKGVSRPATIAHRDTRVAQLQQHTSPAGMFVVTETQVAGHHVGQRMGSYFPGGVLLCCAFAKADHLPFARGPDCQVTNLFEPQVPKSLKPQWCC